MTKKSILISFSGVLTILCSGLLSGGANAAPAPTASPSFDGAQPDPIGKVSQSVSQIRIRFPAEMVKQANKNPFQVSCLPQIDGFSGWADNNTTWTYDFKTADDSVSPSLAGGAKCHVSQVADLSSSGGKTWKSGAIAYDLIVTGPNVTNVTPAHGFGGLLRESEPVVLIEFDGPVDRAQFFQSGDGYLGYTSENAPAEKIALAPVPQDQAEKIFSEYRQAGQTYLNYKDRNWVLATTKQNLIEGAKVRLTIQSQVSADNRDVRAEQKFAKDLAVRSHFQADIRCANPSAKTGSCMPQSPIAVVLNGEVKWTDLKNAYIEYIPFKSSDRKTVRSYAEIPSDRKIGFWDSLLDRLADYFPFLAKYSDTIVDTVVFNVNIEPVTQATIVLPAGLQDTDGRRLADSVKQYRIRIGAMDEMLQTPQRISFFEKNVPNVFFPVNVVNQNQKLTIRKSGTDPKVWTPIRDVATMIKALQAYAVRDDFRDKADYISPLVSAQIASTVVDETLTGQKNRVNMLQFPFGAGGKNAPAAAPMSGLYAIEISSPSYEAGQSEPKYHRYYNPKYALAQVTDLSVNLKVGETSNLAWVTRLSNAQSVPGAQVEIYSCAGEKIATYTTNASGLVSFPKQIWAKSCPGGEVGTFSNSSQFFIAATFGEDIALAHSSWSAPNSYALTAPGVDWFQTSLTDNQPHYHAIIGVNLVKPGQQVPVELVANIPVTQGFRDVPAAQLPAQVRVMSADDSNLYYDFPLTWNAGKAQFTWQVPASGSVRLGRYTIVWPNATEGPFEVDSGDIEVAEFKVPLMSGLIAFPKQALVQPSSIPVSSVVHYANGVGAKKLATELSYYFAPTSFQSVGLQEFTFGTGPLSNASDDGAAADTDSTPGLPSNSRPAVLSGLSTADDGSLTRDIALEKTADGHLIGEVLKTTSRPQKLVVRVRYQDQVGEFQTLSQSKDIFNANLYVGTSVVAGPRQTARLRAAVVDVNAKNLTVLSDLELKITRIETRVIGEELFGGLIKNTLEKELQPVRWPQNCTMEKAVVSCAVGALKQGSYAFEATSKSSSQVAHTLFKVDSDGRVYGANDYYGFGDDDGAKQLPLALDKKTYSGGDLATVSFAAPFKTCQALVTIERSDVINAFVVPDACQKGQIQVKTDASFAPNAFVSVYAITGRASVADFKPGDVDLGRPTYRLGYANLKVNWDRFKANVSVKTAKAQYEPGDTVEVEAKVSAASGQLQSATVTFVAIEEKILELKPNTTYQILDAMMGLRGHDVQTVTQLERIETITSGSNQDAPGAAAARKGGAEGGDGSSKSDFKRKLFNALVTFQADVPVINGVAKYSFKTNDSLTRFKIFAIATDSGQKFGEGDVEYLTEKDTQTYSNLPSVARTGDDYPLRVTVQNNSTRAGLYKTVIVATIKDASGKVIATKTLSGSAQIDKSGSQAIDVGHLEIPENAASIDYSVTTYNENGQIVDSMQPETQTVLASVPVEIHDVFINQLVNGSLTKTLVKDAAALPGKGEIRVAVSTSLVTTALAQIRSRVENATFADFFLESKFDRALLRSNQAHPQEIQKVLETLVTSTDDNGFIKYYSQATRGSVWLTAKIINSLRQEPWALALVSPALKAKLNGAVLSILKKTAQPEYVGAISIDKTATAASWMRAQTVMAQAAFAFPNLVADARAVNAAMSSDLVRDPKVYGLPIEQWTTRDLIELWRLQTLADTSHALASPVYTVLTSAARLVYAGNLAQLKGAPSDSFYYSDETIETAELLGGLAEVKGNSDLARTLATGLVAMNDHGWYNVSTMASVAQGLKGFGRAFESVTVTGQAVVTIPEEQQSTTIDFATTSAGLLRSPWTANTATVKVASTGAGQPWVGIQASSAIPLKQARGQGLSLDKLVRNVNRDGATMQAGDMIEVTLTIHAGANLQHVALNDPIPAGANIVGDAYGDLSSGEKSYSGYKFYFDNVGSGDTTVKYQYQLNNPGQFKMPPTRAEGIYLPSVYAETPNATVTVQ